MGILITEQLLRAKSEHNEGVLYTLEEISLHQLNIDRITMINSCCRELKILYLQNNNIRRIENINRCKELRYVNFAINKIRQIEGLHRCEFIEKLDFTVNRIDARGLLTFERLKANHHLEELYCTGNPCTDIEGYRKFVIHAVPSVTKLDGEDVTPAERVAAGQEFAAIKKIVEAAAEKEEALPEPVSESESEDEEPEPEKEKSKFENFGKKAQVKGKTPGIEPDPKSGVVRQCNEGNYPFKIEETDECIIVEVGVSKFLDTSLIDADIHPGFVRVEIKKKVLQLLLPCDCRTDTAAVQRSQTTGALMLRCPKVNPTMRKLKKPVGVAPEPYVKPTKKDPEIQTLEGGEQGTSGGVGDIRRIAKESPYGQEHRAAADQLIAEGAAHARAVADDIDDDAPPDF